MSTLVERLEVIDCSNPKLDVFITLNGVLVNPFSLTFAIFDIANPLLPVQTFPVAGFEPVDPANDCPVGQRISTGHLTSVWTVDVAEPLTNHKITWRFALNSGDAEQEFEQPFNVVSVAGAQDPVDVADFRCRFPDWADQAQFPPELISKALTEANNCVDAVCFGLKTDIAREYYAAHLLAYVTGGARAKGATNVSAGSASIGWDAAKMNLDATAYGQHYQFMARGECGSARVLC